MIPSALEHVQKFARSGERLAVFLDYDGTLTPIVSHPENAWLSESMRQTLRSLAGRVPVAILSGRDLDDVRGRVHVDGLVYAGSHGFDISGAGGLHRELGASYLPVLDAAEAELREALDEIPGAQLERKHFSVAAHYRNVNENDAIRVAEAVEAVAARHRKLRRINGTKGKLCSGSWKRWNLSAETRSRFSLATIARMRTPSARSRNAGLAFSSA